jgi:hypothetical protein
MVGDPTNELQQLNFASRHGILVNSNDGFYQRGKSYGMDMKLFVAAKYLDHKTADVAEWLDQRLK